MHVTIRNSITSSELKIAVLVQWLILFIKNNSKVLIG